MKGRFFESLVKFLEESFKDNPSTTVQQNVKLKDQGGIDREFDIVIDSTLNGYPIRIVVECKDYKRKIEMTKIEAFKAKCDSISGIHLRVFVAKSGFQANAIEIANRYGINLHTLSALEPEDVSKWVKDSGFEYLTSQAKITNVGIGYISDVLPQIGDAAVFHFDSVDDEGIQLQVLALIIYENRKQELQDLVFSARADASAQEYKPTSLTFQLIHDFSGSGLYVIDKGIKQYISQFRLSFQFDFSTMFLTPDFSGNYHDLGLDTSKGRIFVYRSALGAGQDMTVVKRQDSPNHTHIYLSGPNGTAIPFENAPRLFLPQGLDVESTNAEVTDLLIRRGGQFKFEKEEPPK